MGKHLNTEYIDQFEVFIIVTNRVKGFDKDGINHEYMLWNNKERNEFRRLNSLDNRVFDTETTEKYLNWALLKHKQNVEQNKDTNT